MIQVRWRHWTAWAAATAATTALLLSVRGRLDKAHVALLYLLLVLAGSVAGGRPLGLTLAAIAFLLFNWFFLEPYNTLTVADPLDWLVLVTFLAVGAVAAQIVHRLKQEADDARQRAAEVDRLAALGAETLSVPQAEDALAAIAEVIRSTLGLTSCRIHRGGPDASLADETAAWVARSGKASARLADGTTRLTDSAALDDRIDQAVAIRLPLLVRDRVVGVLELEADRPIGLDPSRRRFLAALSYYAALGVERVRLEAEAARAEGFREADRLKDAFLASVSHDLRTPLTTIKAIATELAVGGDERAHIISEEADRLNRLVAGLLDLSRLRGGGFPIHAELNAVDDLVGAALQRATGILGDRELTVSLADGGSLLVGRFDLGQSIRILVNLLENAHRYAPPGTPLELTVQVDGSRLILAVSDRGPGVPDGERERIFEAFYRPPGAAPDNGGAGLGLAIARQLATAQGGTLSYAPRPGGGSTFTLTLPSAELERLAESL